MSGSNGFRRTVATRDYAGSTPVSWSKTGG